MEILKYCADAVDAAHHYVEQIYNESTLIVESDAVSSEEAMMISLEDARFTQLTMMSSGRPVNVTNRTMLPFWWKLLHYRSAASMWRGDMFLN